MGGDFGEQTHRSTHHLKQQGGISKETGIQILSPKTMKEKISGIMLYVKCVTGI